MTISANNELSNLAEECLLAARQVEAAKNSSEADTVRLVRAARRLAARSQEIHNRAAGNPPPKHG
jgi:hypothetical protein